MSDENRLVRLCNALNLDYFRVNPVYDDQKLVKLDLSGQGIAKLPDQVFAGLSNLEKLDLSNNPLETLSGEVFSGLDQLMELSLASNSISRFNNPFVHLSGLLVLNINFVYDVSLTPELLKPLSNLSILILSSKTPIPDDFLHFAPLLRALHITSSTQLNPSFFGSINLRELYISGQTRIAPGLFDHLGNIVELHISNNAFTALPRGLFDELISLEILNLSNNSIRKLDASLFTGLQSLRELDLSHNSLNYIPGNINLYLPQLEVLRIEDNHFSDISISGISIYF